MAIVVAVISEIIITTIAVVPKLSLKLSLNVLWR